MSNQNRNSNDNFSHPEEARKLWPFFFIIPILGFSFLPIGGSLTSICDNTGNLFECGPSSATTTSGTQTLTVTQTFPIPFQHVPEVTLGPVTLIGVVVKNDIVIPMIEPDPAITVTNVPAGDSEIPNHRMQINAGMVSGQSYNFCFEVTATGLTALGKIKYSTDGGTTFLDLSTPAVTASLALATGLICATASTSQTVTGIIAPFTTNGAGLGDSPTITNVSLDYIIQAWAFVPLTVLHLSVSTTQFKWQAKSLAVFAPQTISITWQAVSCGVIDCPVQ